MKRKLLFTALALVVLLVAAGLIAKQVLVGYLTPDFVVRQIESHWNCRAEVTEVNVHLLGTATVELRGVALAPRDSFADDATPLEERTPLPDGTAELQSGSVLLEIRPGELIRRHLNIRQLVIDGLQVSTTINRDGDASLEKLFDEPAKPVLPLVASEAPTPKETGGPEEGTTVSDEESFHAGDLNFSAAADRMEVKDGQLAFHVEASGAEIRLESFSLALTDIDVDPGELDVHNRAAAEFGGDLIVRPPADSPAPSDLDYLNAHISGNGRIQPFNPETGEVDPVWTVNLTIHQGAEISTFPVIAQLQNLLKDVDTAGVDLSDLNLRGTLLADATTAIGHAEGKYLIKEPLALQLPDTLLQIEQGSWFHTGTNEHKMKATLVASETLTHQIEGKVDAYLQRKAGNLASANLRSLLMSPVMKDGQLTIEVSSKGDLSKPKVDLVTPLGNLSEVLGVSKDTMDSLEKTGKALLKNLFGK
ncbi:MAG: hypothetical protein KDN19_09270 [Verrucomicrobiae bacterium]|nr:hypothetical protein [Verrucomicrobiae bacterium]